MLTKQIAAVVASPIDILPGNQSNIEMKFFLWLYKWSCVYDQFRTKSCKSLVSMAQSLYHADLWDSDRNEFQDQESKTLRANLMHFLFPGTQLGTQENSFIYC